MTRRRIIAISAVAATIAAIPLVCNETLCEKHYQFCSDKLISPVRLAFLSDVHNTRYGKNMSSLVKRVDKFTPDVVIFGGDLFDRHPDEPNSLQLVDILVKKYPCFYALGNHEFQWGIFEEARSVIAEKGVNVLSKDNISSIIGINGNKIQFLGFDGFNYEEQYNRIKTAVSDKYYNILIYHRPEDFPELSENNFELILAGHAHGGQVRIPCIINGLYAPGQGFFPKYAGGIYHENNTYMVVSRGLERCKRDIIIPRVFNRPETVFITLMPSTK